MVAAGCGGGESDAERLERLGFFDYAREREAAIAEVRADAEAGVFSDRSRRFYFADAEELTEGGVGLFLEQLAPLLRKLGVAQLRVRDSFGEHRYDVSVNGREYAVIAPAELESDLIWGYAAGRTVRIVNDLLRAAGSHERAYGYGDPASNDFGVFILTPQLRDAVAEILEGTADDPFEVTDEAPSFGYPDWEKGFGGRESAGRRPSGPHLGLRQQQSQPLQSQVSSQQSHAGTSRLLSSTSFNIDIFRYAGSADEGTAASQLLHRASFAAR